MQLDALRQIHLSERQVRKLDQIVTKLVVLGREAHSYKCNNPFNMFILYWNAMRYHCSMRQSGRRLATYLLFLSIRLYCVVHSLWC